MNMRKRFGIIARISLIALLFSGITSCMKTDQFEESEQQQIDEFLAEQDIDADPKESGLYYIELIEGTGEVPVEGDTVDVYYRGSFLDGRLFDTNMDSDPFRFTVGTGYVIEGWDEGITYMKKGGEALFIIPSSLAYGSAGTYGIPGYTPLLYEVVLENVIPGPNR